MYIHRPLLIPLVLAASAVWFGCGGDEGGSAFPPATDAGWTQDTSSADRADTNPILFGDGSDVLYDVVVSDAPRIPDPNNPNNAKLDSDCDGLSDLQEYSTQYANGKSTDPGNPDSDGDQIPDGIERGATSSVDPLCANGFTGDADPASVTDPTSTDSDCDGVGDAAEDTNKNGAVDSGETDPTNADSDGDAISDGVELGATQAVPGSVCPGLVVDADPTTKTDPTKADSDGDGLTDGKEDRNHNGKQDVKDAANPKYSGGDETSASQADSDGDGAIDGAEDKNGNLFVDPGETDPLVANQDSDKDGMPDVDEIACGYDPNDPDMDKDGVPDGLEDKNRDCVRNLGETDPKAKDTDCDGLMDGQEDANKNGKVDPTETDPTALDTDGDGLTDGVETGNILNPDPVKCPTVLLDADPATKTDPLRADTDKGGVVDGAEDANKDGKLDPGELNPLNPTDDGGVVGQACATTNLKPIQFKDVGDADALIALATDFADQPGPIVNLSLLTVAGKVRGFLFVDPTHQLGGFVVEKTPQGATPTDEEKADRGNTPCSGKSGHFQQIACLTNPVLQPFTTWDGYPALLGTYDYAQGGGDDLKGRLNLIAKEFLGATVQGTFTDGNEGNAGQAEPWRMQIEIVRRSDNRVVVMGALTTASKVTGSAADPLQPILLSDVVNGSALAQLGDATGIQCDVRKSKTAKVDFLWVVDDSCSMSDHQIAVSQASDAFVAKLNNSQVDYRVAVMSTGYWQATLKGSTTATKNFGKVFPFTTDLATFKSRLAQPCPFADKTCIGDEQCTGTEKGVESVYDALLNPKNGATPLLPPPALGAPEDPAKLRNGARLVIIFVSDAGDQSNREAEYVGGSPPTASDADDGPWWNTNLPKWPAIFTQIAQRPDLDGLTVGAILCSGNNCGETSNPSLYDVLVQQTAGVQGLITDNASVNATMQGIVNAAIGATGLSLSKPPISASIKVVQDNAPAACPQPTPRHPINGFDYDGASAKISFYGDCRPTAPGSTIAISYQYWVDKTSNPNGGTPHCEVSCVPPYECNPATVACECPADCGAPSPGPLFVCEQTSCKWVCPNACGGACGGYTECEPTSCTCKCQQSATCAAGHVFDPVICGCRCDAAALGCDEEHDADLGVCACVCKPDCGGCSNGAKCNVSLCNCEGGIPR